MKKYFKEMIKVGLPVTLQAIFQASYSLIDQIMVGRLGELGISGSGLGGKFSSLVVFTLSSIAAVASILIAQYYGNKDKKGIGNSFLQCTFVATILAVLFAGTSFFFPNQIMGLYTTDVEVVATAASYLRIIAISFLPMMGTMMLAALLRSMSQSKYPMYVSVLSMLCNIVFNYIFIFGKLGMPALGLEGAAIGTMISRSIEMMCLMFVVLRNIGQGNIIIDFRCLFDLPAYKKVMLIMLPLLINEFSWSFGENIYAAIYGRLGTDELTAMTLTGPLQGMFIGMFCGLSSAAVVMVGQRLGQDKKEEAYDISKFLMKAGLIGSLTIAAVLVLLAPWYVKIYDISVEVAQLTIYIIFALAAVITFKILNMILGGGILRSGGNTKYTLALDTIGTWIFGVPLGLLTAFVFGLPIYWVYFILSLEEAIRLLLGLVVFVRKRWMRNVTVS